VFDNWDDFNESEEEGEGADSGGNDASQTLLVVGRAENAADWIELVQGELFDNYTLQVFQPLEEEVGIDGKIRWIAFVSLDGPGQAPETQLHRLRAIGLGAYYCLSMEEAMQKAKDDYGFGTEQEERIKAIQEMTERFPPFTAEETERYSIFDALYHVGRLRILRGRFGPEGKLVMVLAHIAASDHEVHVTPLAMLTPVEIAQDIELPLPGAQHDE
jgi:hypothetical protein